MTQRTTGQRVIVGSSVFAYEVVPDWAKLPSGWSFLEVAAVGVDARDRVYVFSRGAHPMTVFDRDGKLLSAWGEGLFPRPHGITMGPDETLYLTDDGDHTVKKCTLDGKVLMTLGVPNQPSAYFSGEPFNRCTHVALDPKNGDIFVSDGYNNARIHKYTASGKYLSSWGNSGMDLGEFNIPHNIVTGTDGLLYVADRENHRIQAFDTSGTFKFVWQNSVHRPCALCRGGPGGHFYVGELGPALAFSKDAPNLGPRVSILDQQGKLLARLGDIRGGEAPGQFIAPHGIAVDSRGDIYVGEVSWTVYGKNLTPPREVRSLRKLVRKP